MMSEEKVLITGATGGLGTALAAKCIGEKQIMEVYLSYRNEDKFKKLYQDIGLDNRIKPLLCGNQEMIERLVAESADSLIICVHTAFSIVPLKRIGSFTQRDVKENISANISEFVLLMNQLQRCCTRGNTVRIVNIDSGAAYREIEGWSLYSSGKAFANMFLKTMKLENPEMQIITYEPGVMDTAMQETIRSSDKFLWREEFQGYYTGGMLRTPEAVAKDIFTRFIMDWKPAGFEERFRE